MVQFLLYQVFLLHIWRHHFLDERWIVVWRHIVVRKLLSMWWGLTIMKGFLFIFILLSLKLAATPLRHLFLHSLLKLLVLLAWGWTNWSIAGNFRCCFVRHIVNDCEWISWVEWVLGLLLILLSILNPRWISTRSSSASTPSTTSASSSSQ